MRIDNVIIEESFRSGYTALVKVKITEASSFGRELDRAASTGDVVCRLFGTSVTTVALGQSWSVFAPNLPTPVRSLFSRVQVRRDNPHSVRCLMVSA